MRGQTARIFANNSGGLTPTARSLGLADGTVQRRSDQCQPPDCVQRLGSGADACSRNGGGDEEQQRGGGFPCKRLRYGGERGMLDQRKLPQLRKRSPSDDIVAALQHGRDVPRV